MLLSSWCACSDRCLAVGIQRSVAYSEVGNCGFKANIGLDPGIVEVNRAPTGLFNEAYH